MCKIQILRIAVIENEKNYAEALQLALAEQFDCTLYFTGEEAIQDVQSRSPEVILLDIDLGTGRMNGIECISHLKAKLPHVQFLVLTIFEDTDKVFDALSAGALGYVLKSSSNEKIAEAIHELKEGGSPMSPSIARKIVSSLAKTESRKVRNDYLLSPREIEVIQLISQGKMEKEVADLLFISIKTVKTHISNIYQKLQVRTRVEALNKYFGR